MAVGHVRYGTTGGTNRANCQPIEGNHRKGKMALAHNGNLSNAFQLRSELEAAHYRPSNRHFTARQVQLIVDFLGFPESALNNVQ